jgi:hypothetical protein
MWLVNDGAVELVINSGFILNFVFGINDGLSLTNVPLTIDPCRDLITS